MERKELLAKNVEIISAHAGALDELAARDVRVVVVANPANTLALVAKRRAASLPTENFSCLTRLDHDRLRGAVAKKLTGLRPAGAEVAASQVRNAVIWGNHSSTQVPSAAQAEVNLSADLDPRKWRPLREVLRDDVHGAWLHGVRRAWTMSRVEGCDHRRNSLTD